MLKNVCVSDFAGMNDFSLSIKQWADTEVTLSEMIFCSDPLPPAAFLRFSDNLVTLSGQTPEYYFEKFTVTSSSSFPIHHSG
jgi:hypothetical protein